MYCRSEIYIAAPTYILPLRNMLSRRHAHVRKPSLCSKIWAPTTNGSITASYRCNRLKCPWLWRCHIAPAKPNGPIPFDLNDKRCNLTGQIVFSICHRAHTDIYRVYTGSCPAWYRTLRPHTVLACISNRFLTVSSPCAYRFL